MHTAYCPQDAAWSSFALLRNSNICGVLAVWEGRAVLARGLVGLPAGAAGDADAVLAGLTQVCSRSKPLCCGRVLLAKTSRQDSMGLPCIRASERLPSAA